MEKSAISKKEEGIIDSDELNQVLTKMVLLTLISPMFFIVLYLLNRISGFYELKNFGAIVIGIVVGTIISIFITEWKPSYVYKYSFENANVKIYLVNLFGRKKTSTISTNEIIKIKYRAKRFTRRFSKIWIHFKENVDEYSFINYKIGINFCDDINVEKI